MNFEFLKKYIEDWQNYVTKLETVYGFLNEHHIEVDAGNSETFWNHMATLFERISTRSQNNLEIPQEHGLKDVSIDLAEKLEMSLRAQFDLPSITEFEKFLVALYIDQFFRKEGKYD